MNPHFIFNCLNSIDNLIQNNKKKRPRHTFKKFAKLLRAILENSKNEQLPCWKGLGALRLYIELEVLRPGDKFLYPFNIDPKIYQGDDKVPPMVLQPFVQNAIPHGLLNKPYEDKTLLTQVEAIQNNSRYTIQDDGVGRVKAAFYKHMNSPARHPYGVQITAETMRHFNNSIHDANNNVVTTILYDASGLPTGTKVEVCLKN